MMIDNSVHKFFIYSDLNAITNVLLLCLSSFSIKLTGVI